MSKTVFQLTIDGECKGQFKTFAEAKDAEDKFPHYYMARIEPIYYGFNRKVYERRALERKKYWLD